MVAVPVDAGQELTQPHHDVKLFNRWTFDDVQVAIFFSSSDQPFYGCHTYFYAISDAGFFSEVFLFAVPHTEACFLDLGIVRLLNSILVRLVMDLLVVSTGI